MEDSKERAKELICKIISHNGGAIVRKGHIYKAFHAAHLYYYQTAKGLLSDYPIVKMPKGPGIENCDELFSELIDEGKIQHTKVNIGPYRADRYEYVGSEIEDLDSEEDIAIKRALDFVRDKDTNYLAEATHNEAWNRASMGSEMDIYLDTLTETELDELKSASRTARKLMASVFE